VQYLAELDGPHLILALENRLESYLIMRAIIFLTPQIKAFKYGLSYSASPRNSDDLCCGACGLRGLVLDLP
jgi:hypothetical protein